MAISRKAVLAALASAALLAGCATGPYYDDYGYYGQEGYGYGYGNDARYYGPSYYGPSIGLGFTYSDRDYRRHGDNRNREWRRDGRERNHWRDRDRSDWRDGRSHPNDPPPSGG